MTKTRKSIPKRMLCILLTAMLLIGMVPVSVFAKNASTGTVDDSVEYTVIAHGGIIKEENTTAVFDGTAKAGTVLEITLDEAAFGGHDFVCWKGDDGTEIPKKSFRLLVERNTAFYPIFSDLTGTFGDWRELVCGELCTDGIIYVREDTATGLKEYKWEEGWHQYGENNTPYDDTFHKTVCTECGYEEMAYHWYDDGVVTTEPTHTAEGVKTYTCRSCGYTKTEPVPVADPYDHTYGEWEIITEAKDGQPGYRKKTCACGDTVEGYYIKAEWEKYYKTRNVEMHTTDRRFGMYQYEWHYSFQNEDGNDVYIYLLKRYGRDHEDVANYGFMFVDDRTDALKPIYIMKNRARYGQFAMYNGYTWSQLEYARSVDEYIEKIDSMILYGGGATQNYSSKVVDAFKAWETLYNQYAGNNPEWYLEAGYTRTECEYLGYDCWEYKKINDIPNYNDTIYRVVKSDNTCLYAEEGTPLTGYSIDAVKDMYYEALPTFEDDTAKYEWRKTHCVVNEIGTATEQSSKTEITFSTAAPEQDNAGGYRFFVVHQPLVRGSATPQYDFYGRLGEDDHSWNFDIIPRNQDISDYDSMDDDAYSVTLVQIEDDNYDFDHWEKYDWETDTWSVYEGPLKFNYVVSAKNPDGSVAYDDDGHKTYIEDHRLTEIQYFRGIYNLKTRHVKVEGGTFIYNGERVSEADVPHGTVISLGYTSKEGYIFDGFTDTDGNKLYYKDYSSITVEKDMTYTADFTKAPVYEETHYIDARAENGSVTKDGEEFYGGSFEAGVELTFTTTGNEGYPYFLGWYTMDGKSGEYVLYSKDTTLHYTVTDYAELIARWSKTETEQKFNITVVNGFVRAGYEKLAVSAVSVSENRDISVIKDPTSTLKIKNWILTGTLDNGNEFSESQEYSEYGNGFYLRGAEEDGEQIYPWDITVIGETIVCTEHDWDDGVITKQPTYTEYGEITYTCRICGAQKTEPIPMLARYCVHACGNCGGCTLPADDTSCDFARCTCTDGDRLPVQNGPTIDFSHNGSGSITPNVFTVLYEEHTDNPYVQYVLRAAEGYDVEEIYDISLTDANGNKYTLADGETVTVTLTVGSANAQALLDGRMYIVHITDNGNVIYGLGHEAITVNVDAGTVTFTVDSFSPFVLARNAIEYYGRAALADMPNSTALLYAYDQIAAGISTSKAEISVYNGTDAITQAELETVFDAYRCDHTEHFWLGNSYSIRYTSSTVTSLIPSYVMSGAELETAKEAFNNAVSELLAGISPALSQYEREKLLHDRLAAKISYESAANAHNAYGALVEGKAVCEGYAEAYQYLLQLAGLQSFIVTGTSVNPATGAPEGHAWNIVRIDSRYYHVDLTWNDQGEHLFYAYFNKTDARIAEDHTVTATAYALPVCNLEVADYFTVNGGKMETFNAETVGTMLKNGGLTARVYVTGDKNAFIEAFQTNIRTVAEQAGVSGGFTYGYANLGREYILTIVSSGYIVSGTATSFNNDTDDVTIQLIKSGTTEAAYETTVTGNNINYSIAGVAAGTYTMKVMKQNHVTREYTVTVGNSNVTQDVKIHLLGDINGDGKLNIADVGKANAHVKKTSTLTDYEFACSDINGDGKINIADVGKMNAHVKKTSLLW